ncbi:hypothetical protein BBBOND_0304160 [Babesia bigemina]|uniref:C3H1-type domain-containing protein n=1 Tax=Babesia bigemina TaxID=5866 RepID=A0A061D954_BABBI|nr:hypothetical protein BBBOND_0304160 [Babesia bigemina]CDR96512.1 hypothetical protein BBBOND_0304160 [Babesia bigemina]|eukprot:XP_012768698.1 hypothetical protein BBBOND_0304160 [Babesia bigemina]
MAPQFKKLTDCPENLREAIDWLIQIKNGKTDGIKNLSEALQKFITDAIWVTQDGINSRKEKVEKIYDIAAKRSMLNKLGEQEKSFDKLQESLTPLLENLQLTSKYPEKNFLTQLCAGLETFIGYNSGNYTGEGIVYGDCDRLRDAVTMFLNGVFDSIKSDDAVGKYVVNVDEIIKFLNKKIGNGHAGFISAISSVESTLSMWNNMFTQRTNEVKGQLGELKDKHINKYSQNIEAVKDNGCTAINTSLMQSIVKLKAFLTGIRKNDEGFNGLDTGLKDKLNVPLEKIDEGIEMLQHALHDEDLSRAVKVIESTFNKLPAELYKFISDNVTITIGEYEKAIKKIKQKVKNDIVALRDDFINKRLALAQKDLQHAVERANSNASNLGGLRNGVVKSAIEIIEKMLNSADTVEDQKALLDLKAVTVGPQIEAIRQELSEGATNMTNALKTLNTTIEEPTETFKNKHQDELISLVEQARNDLTKALHCANEHAKNLGGLKNKTVEVALNQIEERLNTVDTHVNSLKTLQELAQDPVGVHIGHITDAKNPGGSAVEIHVTSLQGNIDGPDDAFNKHKSKLSGLARKAQTNLDNIIGKAQDCIMAHGGLNNVSFKNAIQKIQEKLDTVETDRLDSMDALKRLEKEPVGNQTQAIKLLLNKDAEQITKNLKNLEDKFANTDKVFAGYKRSLESLAEQAEKDLVEALVQADVYVLCTDFGLKKKIMDAFGHVLKTESKNRTGEAKNLAKQVVAKLNALNKDFNSSYRGDINNTFTKLPSYISTIESRIEAKLRSNGDNDTDIIAWIYDVTSSLLDYTLKEANADVIKSDQAYRKSVKAALQLIKVHIQTLKTNAQNDQLEGFLGGYERHFSTIQSAVTDHSVYDDDKKAREKYFSNLMQLFNDTISTLSVAYKNAYKSAAKSYLSGAISKINAEVKAAEVQYQMSINGLTSRIASEIVHLMEKARQDKLGEVISNIDAPLKQITEAIKQKSVFQSDIADRETYFDNLRDLITNNVHTLDTAYQNAYKSAAKAYLNGAISAIKGAVNKVQHTYVTKVKLDVDLSGINHEVFTKQATRAPLTGTLTVPFTEFLQQVEKNSIFIADFTERKECFNQLQKLITGTLATLSAAYKKAYQSSAKTYLSNAIYAIRQKVNTAELQYTAAVSREIEKLKGKITALQDDIFKDDKSKKKEPKEMLKRKQLGESFTEIFKELQKTVEENSAFRTDLNARRDRFTQLQTLIKNTTDTIAKSSETFDICVTLSDHYLNESFKDADHRFNMLGSSVKVRVKEAFDKITAEVRTMYAKDRIANIRALQSLVERQQINVGKIIEEDRLTGIKGLLQLLKTWFNMKNAELTNAETMGSVAAKFKGLYDILHKYVKFLYDGMEVEGDSDTDDNPVSRPAPPPISGGGYRARPAMLSVSSKDPNAPQPAGRAGYSGEMRRTSTGQQFLSAQPIKDPISDYFDRLDHHTRGLFGTLSSGYFNKSFASKLEEFVRFLEPMSPFKFGRHCDPLLYILKSGLQSFLRELGRAYISTYCGAAYVFKWEINGDKCAKVCLTMLEILFHDLDGLRNKVKTKGEWNDKHIRLYNIANSEKTDNHLGAWFQHRGFTVSVDKDTQNGELSRIKTGADIITRLVGDGTRVNDKIYAGPDKTDGALQDLHYHLEKYYEVCHRRDIPDARAPTTIYEMLHWLGGLWYNPVFVPLQESLKKLLEDVERENKVETDKLKVALPYRRSVSMTRTLTRKELIYVFNNSTIRANKMLIAILGHGQEDGRYACDFLTNPDDLLYPSNPDKCLDLLVEISLRVNHQIRFLFKQCHNGPECGGWRDCLYGKGVGGSRWQCNELQCSNQECDQKCRQYYSCGVKSPLQLFLEDGLPGFLPHPFEKPDCKITCSLPNHNGIPCKTPMGFRDLSIRASHQQKGERIKKVLDWFCGTENESLNLLCSYFLLLLRRPPQTLCDMFAFYYNFLDHYDDDRSTQKEHRRLAFNDAVTRANLGCPFDALNPSTILCTSKHNPTDGKPTHEKGDLFSLLSCNPEDSPTMPCGRYLQSIGDDIRLLYYGEHAGLYLSWIIYQAETFYNLLKDLSDRCCKSCTSPGSICYGTRCAKDCHVASVYKANKSTDNKEDLKALDGKKHNDECNSIVNCSNTHSILYTYGFTFGSPFDLSGGNNKMEKKRTCQDFCRALDNVLNKEKHVEAPLAKLVFDIIPEYLWVIREPFFWTTVALWLLSLLYLLHIMVIRLDLLHIKSHLHSPSSHRIAAQSLLAAGRVSKLGKISYLQP